MKNNTLKIYKTLAVYGLPIVVIFLCVLTFLLPKKPILHIMYTVIPRGYGSSITCPIDYPANVRRYDAVGMAKNSGEAKNRAAMKWHSIAYIIQQKSIYFPRENTMRPSFLITCHYWYGKYFCNYKATLCKKK